MRTYFNADNFNSGVPKIIRSSPARCLLRTGPFELEANYLDNANLDSVNYLANKVGLPFS